MNKPRLKTLSEVRASLEGKSPEHAKEQALFGYGILDSDDSITHQLHYWVIGIPTHNPVRDECCPDFSCCCPQMLAPERLRVRFYQAAKEKDHDTCSSMLGMFLSGAFYEIGRDDLKVITGTEAPKEH